MKTSGTWALWDGKGRAASPLGLPSTLVAPQVVAEVGVGYRGLAAPSVLGCLSVSRGIVLPPDAALPLLLIPSWAPSR